MRKIGNKTIKACKESCGALLNIHSLGIDEAYNRAEDALTISLKLKLSPSRYGGIDIKADISFIAEQVKDTFSDHVNEDQMELFPDTRKVIRLNIKPIDEYHRGPVGRTPRGALGGR